MRSSTNKTIILLAYKRYKHFFVTPNDCHGDSAAFKQVKTFRLPLYDCPSNPWYRSGTVFYSQFSQHFAKSLTLLLSKETTVDVTFNLKKRQSMSHLISIRDVGRAVGQGGSKRVEENENLWKISLPIMVLSLQQQRWSSKNNNGETILKFLGARMSAINLFQVDFNKPWNYLWYLCKKALAPPFSLKKVQWDNAPVMPPLFDVPDFDSTLFGYELPFNTKQTDPRRVIIIVAWYMLISVASQCHSGCKERSRTINKSRSDSFSSTRLAKKVRCTVCRLNERDHFAWNFCKHIVRFLGKVRELCFFHWSSNGLCILYTMHRVWPNYSMTKQNNHVFSQTIWQ